MEDEFATSSSRTSPKRMSSSHRYSSRISRKESLEETKHRIKSEMHLTREFIDFDVIKGSAFFHTKPSNHDKKLVKQGFKRALFVPFHATFWSQKPQSTSAVSSFEVLFPLGLLFLVAIGYGRVSSTLQAGDTELPAIAKLLSPTNKATASSSNPNASPESCRTVPPTNMSFSPLSSASSGIGSDLAESENSDSTDSEEDSGNSSSSSDEANPGDEMFATANPSAPATPYAFPSNPGTPAHTPRSLADRESMDHFARRRVTVCVWENGVPRKKAMSITELRNTILAKEPVEAIYLISRLHPSLSFSQLYLHAHDIPIGASVIALSCMLCTYTLAFIIFSALADAELTYHRRFLYAKCFTALTSSRRSRLMKLPHFRLKNVVNIKAWISLRGGRTWLKRQGRQRAADEVVSTSFLINLVLLVIMGMQAVSENTGTMQQQKLIHVEVTMWCLLSRSAACCAWVVWSHSWKSQTHLMNVYLRLLVKPHKKEKLLVSNNVLKLASKLLKELNPPNKVSGLTMNPLLYNITRVVVLSAFSSTASEFFGFKLKLWKMKSM
ncbi:Homeodomain transcription factor, partial [Globisporangium splendens]